MSFNRREITISIANTRNTNTRVRLPNHYTHAKLEKVLPITSKDIKYFISIVYYSWVNDA